MCGLAIGALGIHNLGMGTGRIEELNIGKLTVDELVAKKRSEGLESVIRVSSGFPGVLPTRLGPVSQVRSLHQHGHLSLNQFQDRC